MSRILDWIDRDNARTDAILAGRSNTWLIGRTLIGVAVAGKGTMLGIDAAHAWQYALAPLLLAGGLMYAFESVKILIGRAKGRSKA